MISDYYSNTDNPSEQPAKASWPFVPSTSIIDERAIQSFRSQQLVVLSPHFDDACFSLGTFLVKVGRGDLVNVFTHGNYFKRTSKSPSSVPEQTDVYSIRDREDAAFAAKCGLTRYDLGCEEPSLRGRRPSELHLLDDDVGQITKPLLATLARLANGAGVKSRKALFAPLGVGRHVNHRAVAAVVLYSLPQIQTRYDVYFYEDLPYAGDWLHRITALWRAGRLRQLRRRFALKIDWGEKAALVALYPTQLLDKPVRSHYWPKALRPFAPHEAFWLANPVFSSNRGAL